MCNPWILRVGLLFALNYAFTASAGQSSKMILALGSPGFLDSGATQAATGAVVKHELENFQLKHFAVVVLANIALAALPPPVQEGLDEYVTGGGALLLTGGPQSFGSGGYQAVAAILPFEIRSGNDWRFTPFRPPVVIQPGHPILAGVTFIPVGTLNDMNPRRDATEVLQAAGGGSAGRRVTGAGVGGGGSFPYPLIAEVGVGAGRVLGIAFDLNEFATMQDRDLFVRNTIAYLLSVSRMGPVQ